MRSRYVHQVTIERRVFDDSPDARDSYGQPAMTTTGVAAKALVQPRSAREMDDHRSAGAELADHVIFLPVDTDLDGASAIVWDSRRYEVTGIRPFRFGRLQHLEVDARLITAQPVTFVEAGS